MTRKTNKTPSEIFQELQAKTEAARIRMAKAEAQDNPILAQLQASIDAETKAIVTLSRKLAGKNSFANRIEAAEKRLTWVRAEQALTIAQDKNAKARKDALQHGLADLALRISEGQSVTGEDVNAILANLPVADNLPALIAAEQAAKQDWKDTVAKNGGDSSAEETPAA